MLTLGHRLPLALREYYQFCEHLYTVNGVILYKNCIVIPPSLRQHVLAVLHSAHQGVTFMKARADSTLFWTGITPAITALQETCNSCNRMPPSQPSAPPSPTVYLCRLLPPQRGQLSCCRRLLLQLAHKRDLKD